MAAPSRATNAIPIGSRPARPHPDLWMRTCRPGGAPDGRQPEPPAGAGTAPPEGASIGACFPRSHGGDARQPYASSTVQWALLLCCFCLCCSRGPQIEYIGRRPCFRRSTTIICGDGAAAPTPPSLLASSPRRLCVVRVCVVLRLCCSRDVRWLRIPNQNTASAPDRSRLRGELFPFLLLLVDQVRIRTVAQRGGACLCRFACWMMSRCDLGRFRSSGVV